MDFAKPLISMTSAKSRCQAGAFTLVELLCVIAIIGILAALLLPVLGRGKAKAQRIVCGSNLGQLGIAFQIFMHDHNGKFPMQVPMSDGGSQEFVRNGYAVDGEFYFSYRHFQVLSNESLTPGVLICPTDKRQPASNLGALQNGNISYFVGVNADYAKPGSILAGDRNIANTTRQTPTIVHGGAGSQLRWTKELHEYKGNVLLADGHVEEWNNHTLAASPNNSGAVADFVLPSVKAGQIQPAYGGGPASSSRSSSASTPGYSRPDGQRQAGMPEPQLGYHPNPNAVNNEPAAGPIQNKQIETINFSNPIGTGPIAPKVTSITVTQDATAGMSPFDKHVVKSLRPVLEWSYMLILLLLLLFLALELWRRSQKVKSRRPEHKQ